MISYQYALRRRLMNAAHNGAQVGLTWILEIAEDGTTGATGVFIPPVTGYYQIEMHGGGGGGGSGYPGEGAAGGGSGEMIYECILTKDEEYPYTIGTGGSSASYNKDSGQGGKTTFGTDMYEVLGGTGGAIYYWGDSIGRASGNIAADGEKITSGYFEIARGGYGNVYSPEQSYGNGGSVNLITDKAMAGENGGIIITYLGRTSMWPSGYTRVSYIESTGNEFIDTDFVPNQDTRVVMLADVIDDSDDTITLFGAEVSDEDRFNFSISNYNEAWWAFYGDDYCEGALTNRFYIDFNKNVITVNDKSSSFTESTFSPACNLFLFALSNEGYGKELSAARLYSCKIYDDGVLVRDFAPCKNDNGEAGLYDLVNGVFYKGENGPGFIAG